MASTDLIDLYLDTVARGVSHTLYSKLDIGGYHGPRSVRAAANRMLAARGLTLVKTAPVGDPVREEGRDWPIFAQTMVGRRRLDNLRSCIETVLADGVPGDVIETGVWRGGASIFARAVLRAHGADDRTVFVCDSFRGLPPSDPAHPADTRQWNGVPELEVGLEEVRANFERYGLLDDGVRFVEGWFKDTLPGLADRTWAVARLDGDMYGSTIDALNNLYPNLSPGGFLIIDDYSIPECRAAVADYRRDHGIDEAIETIDWTGSFWRKRA